MQAGYAHNTAIHPTKNLLSVPEVKDKIEQLKDAIDDAGLTPVEWAQTMKEGRNATRAMVMGTKSEESFVDIQPDYPMRHKWFESYTRLHGLGISSKDDPPAPIDIKIQNNFFDPNSPEVRKIIEAGNQIMMKATEPK